MVKSSLSSPRRVCWYGKLPARGDFVGRGLPPRWRSDWDGWLQRGLALAARTTDGETLRERLCSFAPWRYVALPAAGETWCGIVIASHDRVGRAFPLTLVERIDAPGSQDESWVRLSALLDAVAQGPEALEAVIAALPARAGLAVEFLHPLPPAPGSLWWPLGASRDAAARSAAWPPEPELLLELAGVTDKER
ncbi:type VI secretion system-associated protein TagF [Variovorax rhizosphaerae]|uniref:Type VI secretion system-associated protein TagF n=1 Tax=Variovorax rhizosphaerae TaxID=1836200 RepID=A0ABU8WKF4_9BURK